MPLVPDFIGYLESHLLRELSAVVHEWSQCTRLLTKWEDEHLLEDPTPESIATHKEAIERLLRFGRLLAVATEQPDFANPQLAETRCGHSTVPAGQTRPLARSDAERGAPSRDSQSVLQ